MQCPVCNENIPEYTRTCPCCQKDVGFPNVRKANSSEEILALNEKVILRESEAISNGCISILEQFKEAVLKSSAVMCTALGKINELVSDDNCLYQNFYKAVGSEGRLPKDNKYDKIRGSVDSMFFPNYHEEIRFAVLSIDGTGLTGYGNCCMKLKDIAIEKRTTVFIENTLLFIQKNRIVPGDPLPLGCRASWPNRYLLAVAKLGDRITAETKESEFSGLLMPSRERDGDFIEVHIYGPVKGSAIESLSFDKSTKKYRREDLVLFKSVLNKAKNKGIITETINQ